MKKFISAITSLSIAATMIGAVVPATAGAADASKGFSVKTYDITKPSAADANSTVTIMKSDIPSEGYVIPSAVYYSEGVNGSTDSLLVGITTDSKDISFKLYNPEKGGYTKEEKEYTLNGTKFKTDNYITFAGSYDDLDGYAPAGKHIFGIDSSQTAAGTDNYYIGLSWTNNGKQYKWAGEKSDSYPLYAFDTIIPKNIPAGTYSIKFCQYNTDTTGVNDNPSPLVEGEKKRFTVKDGTLKLETMTIKVVDSEGNSGTSANGDISFAFVDANGKDSVTAKPGDEITVMANLKANKQQISAMDVQFKTTGGLKITQIGAKSPALENSSVSSYLEENRANFTAVGEDGEPLIPADGKAAFTLKVKVPDDAANGDYTVGFGDQCKVFKDSTKFNYATSFTPLKVTVTGGSDSGSGSGSQSGNSDADIKFTFADSTGKSEITAQPGSEITVSVNVAASGKAVSAMDVQFKLNGLELTQIGSKAAALENSSVSSSIEEKRANFTAIGEDGEPLIPTDGKAAFILKVKVPANAANGTYTVGFADQCKVFKDSTKYNYSTAFTPLTITVSGGQDIQYKLGDVNQDGIVDAVDASMTLRYYAKLSANADGGFTEAQKLAADVNKDGIIDAVDASKILGYYAYLSTVKEGTPKSIEEFIASKK